jgi:hypothetical protein
MLKLIHSDNLEYKEPGAKAASCLPGKTIQGVPQAPPYHSPVTPENGGSVRRIKEESTSRLQFAPVER